MRRLRVRLNGFPKVTLLVSSSRQPLYLAPPRPVFGLIYQCSVYSFECLPRLWQWLSITSPHLLWWGPQPCLHHRDSPWSELVPELGPAGPKWGDWSSSLAWFKQKSQGHARAHHDGTICWDVASGLQVLKVSATWPSTASSFYFRTLLD